MRIDVFHHSAREEATERFQREVRRRLDDVFVLLRYLVHQQGVFEMRTLDEVLAVVAEQSTKVESLIVLTDGLRQQVKDALSGATLPPQMQSQIEQIFDQVKSSADRIDAAITQNTEGEAQADTGGEQQA
jgi:hypothetical protein